MSKKIKIIVCTLVVLVGLVWGLPVLFPIPKLTPEQRWAAWLISPGRYRCASEMSVRLRATRADYNQLAFTACDVATLFDYPELKQAAARSGK